MYFIKHTVYRNIYIIESLQLLNSIFSEYDKNKDLVLTYDFNIKKKIESIGGECQYVDHLVESNIMQKYNFMVYKFFNEWNYDANGNDIFTYKNIPFGFSFRQDIWNDLLFYVRAYICIKKVLTLRYSKIYVGTRINIIEKILTNIGLYYVKLMPDKESNDEYYFPIHKWMDEKVRYQGMNGVKYKVRDFLSAAQGTLMALGDRWMGWASGKKTIFIQEYHPTRTIVQRMRHDTRLRLVLASFSRTRGRDRYVPIWGRGNRFQMQSDELIAAFHSTRCAKLILESDVDLTESTYEIFEKRIICCIKEKINILDSIIKYIESNNIDLQVLIANIGKVSTLFDCACKSKNIPSYLIINGMLNSEFMDEGKYATFINGYSQSIKNNYFQNMKNVVCLGDPRMDAYCGGTILVQTINRDCPCITIGASGHNNTDLNSYLAIEFDFLYDVLSALKEFSINNNPIRVKVKVRSNGIKSQYESFCKEYFPDFVEKIIDNESMIDVFKDTDFYISIYSQTLFEASCLGIPCVYYKKDTEFMYPPFNEKSELVTVSTVSDLISVLIDFKYNSPRFDLFLQKEVMEKYIGPLDGHNLQRNCDFIYHILGLNK